MRRQAAGEAVIRTIKLQDNNSYLVLERKVPENLVIQAITSGRADVRLSSAWDAWEGDAMVSVALPLGRPLEQGRLYTFLPMAQSAEAPLAAFVNAPFFAGLDREHLKEAIPLNSLLLDQVALLAASVLMQRPAVRSTSRPPSVSTWLAGERNRGSG